MVTDFLVKTQVKTLFSVSRTTTVRPQIYYEGTGLRRFCPYGKIGRLNDVGDTMLRLVSLSGIHLLS